jgi:hypothetical protein
MLRAFMISAVAVLAFSASNSYAQGREEEAGDRFVEAALRVEHTDVIAAGTGQRQPSGAVLLANSGNATAIVLGCENGCQAPRVRLRVAGRPEIIAAGTQASPRSVILRVPLEYARSLSNLEIQFDLNCLDSAACNYQWALFGNGPEMSVQQRGIPAAITEAQWSGATDVRPQWRQRPTADDLRFYYPVEAWRENRGGSARLQCLVGTGGALNCRVSQEDPSQGGFGEAALRLSTLLRANETDASGQSTVGKRVSVPIVFQPVGS